MRLKSIWISEYKNLRNFSLDFDGEGFLDIFVGKNGTGKSNFFEALIEIFHFIFNSEKKRSEIGFDFEIVYEINRVEIRIRRANGEMAINGKTRATTGATLVPDNVIIYYSGHSDTVSKTVDRYAKAFVRRNRKWTGEEARQFISIGPEYKEMLLSILLLQDEDCAARKYVCQKLGVTVTTETVTLGIVPPNFKHSRVEVGDVQSFLWGAKGISLGFVEKLLRCVRGDFTRDSVYDRDKDRYVIRINRDLFAEEFKDVSSSELFRSLDNLKTLGMFESLSIPIGLSSGRPILIKDFSDGQFQSVYIFAISELFKDRNCITLLDEPDSFLHPEWQFGFLKQVVEVAGTQAAQTNHVLLSSHSASTIARSEDQVIQMFEFGNEGITVTKQDKSSIIKSLSAGLITFSEREAKLSIDEVLENTDDAVLFTEGLSDKIILDAAISKLFPDQNIGLVVQGAFDKNFLRTLFKRNELRENHPGRKMYALFDFDEAYSDWNVLPLSEMVQEDPYLGLGKRLRHQLHCAFLLPIPRCNVLRRQGLNANGEPFTDGSACLPIELLFCDVGDLGDNFARKEVTGGGEIIKFIGNKISFAKQTASDLDADKFECFRPLLEFIRADLAPAPIQ